MLLVPDAPACQSQCTTFQSQHKRKAKGVAGVLAVGGLANSVCSMTHVVVVTIVQGDVAHAVVATLARG
jgi:hypothetical protein